MRPPSWLQMALTIYGCLVAISKVQMYKRVGKVILFYTFITKIDFNK